jgi:signal transduction histidine kinase
MEVATSYSALQAIGFATGFALCAMLGSLQWQVERPNRIQSFWLWLWVAMAVWNGANFMQYTLILAGHSPASQTVGVAALFAWIPLCITPTAILWFICRVLRVSTIVQRLLLVFSFHLSATLIALLLIAVFAVQAPFTFREVMMFAFASAAAHGAALGLIYRRSGEHPLGLTLQPHPPWVHRIAIPMMLTLWVAMAVAVFTSDSGGWISVTSQTIAQQWAIPMAIHAAIYMAEFAFADIVLKRTLRLIGSIALAAGFAYFAFGVEMGLQFVAATIAGAGIIFAAPWLQSLTERFVDQTLLRRPDYHRIENEFAATIEKLTTNEEVARTLAQVSQNALQQSARLAPAVALQNVGEEDWVQSQHDVYIPNSSLRVFMQGEVEFVRSLNELAARRIDALALEDERREVKLREERLRFEVAQAELSALRAQINPHFLFNTLNSIVELIASKPEVAEAMTERLAEFFRYTLTRTEQTHATVKEELEFAGHYLAIEAIRFGDRLRIEIDHDQTIADTKIPALILQPLVENAVCHGLARLREGGTVSVKASLHGDRVQLSVQDDGIGMNSSSARGSGIGLANVRERLRAFYGERATVTLAAGATGRGTLVTLDLPVDGH